MATVLVGQTSSGASTDFVGNGDPVAFKFVAANNGTLATIFASLGTANASLSSMELGIYSHDGVNNRPGTKLASTTTITGAFTGTGTFSGDVSSAAVSIVAGTTYWLALRSVGEQVDFKGNAGTYQEVITSQVLPGTWPAGAGTGTVAPTIWGEDAGGAAVSSPFTGMSPLSLLAPTFRLFFPQPGDVPTPPPPVVSTRKRRNFFGMGR